MAKESYEQTSLFTNVSFVSDNRELLQKQNYSLQEEKGNYQENEDLNYFFKKVSLFSLEEKKANALSLDKKDLERVGKAKIEFVKKLGMAISYYGVFYVHNYFLLNERKYASLRYLLLEWLRKNIYGQDMTKYYEVPEITMVEFLLLHYFSVTPKAQKNYKKDYEVLINRAKIRDEKVNLLSYEDFIKENRIEGYEQIFQLLLQIPNFDQVRKNKLALYILKWEQINKEKLTEEEQYHIVSIIYPVLVRIKKLSKSEENRFAIFMEDFILLTKKMNEEEALFIYNMIVEKLAYQKMPIMYMDKKEMDYTLIPRNHSDEYIEQRSSVLLQNVFLLKDQLELSELPLLESKEQFRDILLTISLYYLKLFYSELPNLHLSPSMIASLENYLRDISNYQAPNDLVLVRQNAYQVVAKRRMLMKEHFSLKNLN